MARADRGKGSVSAEPQPLEPTRIPLTAAQADMLRGLQAQRAELGARIEQMVAGIALGHVSEMGGASYHLGPEPHLLVQPPQPSK
jgi:hypothetical protein